MTDTKAELRRKIAELLRWRVEKRVLSHSGEREWWVLITPSGEIFECDNGNLPRRVEEQYANELWEHTPDWPNDTGAAYQLCVDILEKLDEREARRWFNWSLVVSCGGVMFVLNNEEGRTIEEYTALGYASEALALLALEALERRR